jgi:hypothetical protein
MIMRCPLPGIEKSGGRGGVYFDLWFFSGFCGLGIVIWTTDSF